MSEATATSDRDTVSPLAGIIVKPRSTMRAILDRRSRQATVPLVLAAFFSVVIAQVDWRQLAAAARATGTGYLAGILALASVVCCVVALVCYLLFSISAVLAGRFLGGQGSFNDVRTAVAWGAAPFVWALLYRIPATIFWTDAYQAIHGERQPLLELTARGLHLRVTEAANISVAQILVLGALDVLLIGVYLFVGSSALGEAHGVSSLHGLGTLLLMLLIPIGLLLAIALAVALASG